jgi:membrane fusion protein, multidrug efflux system
MTSISRGIGRSGLIAAGLLILMSGAVLYHYFARAPVPAPAAVASGRSRVPVSVAVAHREDVPIYLTGLGTVQALFTVAIHAQVDGKLQEVFFTEGQRVKKGDVLVKIDPRLYQAALDQAKAKKAEDDAALIAAEKDMVRANTLALKNFGTQQVVDQQQAKVDQTKAAIDADIATIETAQTQFDYTNIVAPSDGRMGVRMVDPGNIVHASDQGAIAILTQTQPSAVLFTLPATALSDVREAIKRGAVEVTAFDQNNRTSLATGKLMLIDNLIDQAADAIRLKALFPNEDEALWPGAFVNVRIRVELRRKALVIPNSAVQSGPQGPFTWVVASNNTVEPRQIEVGPATDDLTIIAAGLADGEHVVTAGQYKLRAKALVVIASVSSSPEPGSVR